MAEIIPKFGQVARQLQSTDMLILGLTFALVGLFVWLGGLGLRKTLAALAGAVCSGVATFIILKGESIHSSLLAAAAGAGVAVVLAKMLMGNSLFRRLLSVLCCAAMGTVMVFAGMILLLLYKGAEPFGYINSRQSFLAAVLLAMTAFGTIEQLLLCKRPKKPSIGKRETDEDKEN